MLKKLQKKFIIIVSSALVIIVFVQLTAINAINIYQRDSDMKNILYLISSNNGKFPTGYDSSQSYLDGLLNPFRKIEITIETPYSVRYFVVKLNKNTVTDISTEHIASVSDHDAFEYAAQVYTGEPGFGFVDKYRYYYSVDNDTDNAIIVFIDYQRDIQAVARLASLSIIFGFLCIFILILPVYLLSKRAMRPVKLSIEKQQQFITDAGHELKTPIAIISADADVLEMCEGENEWVTSIKNQAKRLDGLVKDLVTLSKLEESKVRTKDEVFNLSELIMKTSVEFEALAKTNDVEFIYNVSPSIKIEANKEELCQLISILCDNAVKYTTAGGIIKISLYKSGRSICLDMFNDCENIDKKKLDMLFDRFYRADSSRSRETGGYGIGLSIAQVIVQRNGGKISAVCTKPNSVTFKIVF